MSKIGSRVLLVRFVEAMCVARTGLREVDVEILCQWWGSGCRRREVVAVPITSRDQTVMYQNSCLIVVIQVTRSCDSCE